MGKTELKLETKEHNDRSPNKKKGEMLSTGIKLYIEMHDTLFFFLSLFPITHCRGQSKKKGVGPAPKQPCVFVCLSRLGHERTQIVTLLKASLLYKFTSLFLAASAFRYCRQKQRRRKKKTKKKSKETRMEETIRKVVGAYPLKTQTQKKNVGNWSFTERCPPPPPPPRTLKPHFFFFYTSSIQLKKKSNK